MTTTRNFKARVNKCITGAFCSSLKDQWALKNCTLVLDCSNVHTEIRLFFFFIIILNFLTWDMFQPRIKPKLRTVTLVRLLNRPYICHWNRTSGQLSRAAGNPGSWRAAMILSRQELHHLQVHTRRFQGKLPPMRITLKACIIKSRCYVFSNWWCLS